VDILQAWSYGKIAWWENNGGLSFDGHVIRENSESTGTYEDSVFASDIDRDGDLDVLSTVGLPRDGINWWENDGHENFTEHSILSSSSAPKWVYAADLDGDGDVDILGDGNANAWWENIGGENFVRHTIDRITVYPGYAIDVDADGDVDFLASMGTSLCWWENRDDSLLYFDDFGSSNSRWYVSDTSDVRWSYQDGEYEILLRNPDWWGAVVAPFAWPTDYAVEADMRLQTGDDGRYGLVFGQVDWDHFYLFIVDPAVQFYSVWRYDDPNWEFLTSAYSTFINGPDAINHLRVERGGSQISVYVNDQFLTTVDDNQYTGLVGMGLYIDSGNMPATGRFDNFRVQMLATP
jgi:hypothetical protein